MCVHVCGVCVPMHQQEPWLYASLSGSVMLRMDACGVFGELFREGKQTRKEKEYWSMRVSDLKEQHSRVRLRWGSRRGGVPCDLAEEARPPTALGEGLGRGVFSDPSRWEEQDCA